jgi:GT2 family glycosyltransferase
MKKNDQLKSPVSVVIPNYNGKRLMEKHLPAIFDVVRDGDEVVIVDDASTDESVEWLRETFSLLPIESGAGDAQKSKVYEVCLHLTTPNQKSKKQIDIKLLMNQTNQRFGETANRGVKSARHELIFLLNSDVAPHAGVIEAALPYFQRNDVFGVGCHELEKSTEDQIIDGGKNKLWFERGLFVHSRADNFESGPTAWVSGGSGFFNRSKWLQLGGFDKLFYPAYWEDIDLSRRAQKMGWKTYFEATCLVDHNHETTNQTAFGYKKIAEMSWRNGQKFTWRHANLIQKLMFLVWWPYHQYHVAQTLR